jgi:two-component system LytT family response regulator
MSRKWKVLVVDDEPRARGLLRKMMRSSTDFEIVGECSNGYEAVESVRNLRPDLMLLDVQMPEIDGFAVLDRLRGEEMPQIIFVTAYDEHALRAFEVHALDYLLKPFDQDRLSGTLQRAKFQLAGRDVSRQTGDIISMLEDMKAPPKYLERFMVRLSGRIVVLPADEVVWIEAEDKYVRLHTKSASYLVRDTLARLESCLNPEVFVRVHRSAIVKIGCVREMTPDFHGDYMLVLVTGKNMPLGRNYRERFFELIEGHRQ